MNAIEVRDLHISYKTIKAQSIRKSLFSIKKSTTDRYEAVKGVSFDIKKGEIVGLIGKNGSGKSTLLRSIAGIFSADSGVIDTKGNRVSLLAIGVGFQNELTGKENIFLSGLLMGFTKEQIQEKYNDIVEFSELGSFINAPVKSYSSGMHSKLAFSITAILETDIMLIDETLSVGDRRFKKKSYAKMQELISKKDRTVVIVSHSSETIKKLCDRVIWLDDGEILADGSTDEILKKYNSFMDYQESLQVKEDKEDWYKRVKVQEYQILMYPTNCRCCDDIRHLCRYILEYCPKWKVLWVRKQEDERMDMEDLPIEFVTKGTPEYYKALYSSKIIIDDGMNICNDDVKKHKEQIVYKLLRGSLGIKDVGDKAVSPKRRKKRSGKGIKSAMLVDYCVSNSAFETEVFRSTFWKNNRIIETGHPRNDLFFAELGIQSELRNKIRERYGIPEKYLVALYAPTYREPFMKKNPTEVLRLELVREALEAKFGCPFRILVRTHPKEIGERPEIEEAAGVINVNDYPEMTELLLACDVGITDYASWIFDYLLLKRPGFLYAPDEEMYAAKRGLYYPLKETPFAVAGTTQELVDNILKFEQSKFDGDVEEFLKNKGCVEKGSACRNLVERFEEGKNF